MFCIRQLFEGMKAYRGVDNKVRLFRPDKNAERMHNTAARATLPVCTSLQLCFVIREHRVMSHVWRVVDCNIRYNTMINYLTVLCQFFVVFLFEDVILFEDSVIIFADSVDLFIYFQVTLNHIK